MRKGGPKQFDLEMLVLPWAVPARDWETVHASGDTGNHQIAMAIGDGPVPKPAGKPEAKNNYQLTTKLCSLCQVLKTGRLVELSRWPSACQNRVGRLGPPIGLVTTSYGMTVSPQRNQARLQLPYLVAAERYLREHGREEEAGAVHAAIDRFVRDHADELSGPNEPPQDTEPA